MANNLMQLDPFNEIANFLPLRNFEDLLRDLRVRPVFGNFEAEPLIKMDVSETDQSYTVKAELPGVKKEDVKVAIEGNQVTISAEAKHETEKKDGESVVRRERYFGVQSRSFTLAHEIDDSKSTAKYSDGVLELSLPKRSGNSGRKLLPIG
ncbi:MAG: Hsp20/alpha crystallin family protein [Castellaniella sp.]|uniref:Hsp20/alpha crystallin family protein n=1 Tax=Castellaniella sp. TaxID=1955812 RepID=UPI001213D840|nr:Hsp20/alpha crystallin family protein [Castellaniella sp.]TAN30019.1 MAG: Hsp20/alpha crystallin family protein [Castellaniella sp.]